MQLRTHLEVLEHSATRFPFRPAFKLPVLPRTPDADEDTFPHNGVESWAEVTYSQFQADVELYGKHWSQLLAAEGLPQRCVVGVWLAGLTYTDLLHIYGIARANYIPQLCSLRLPNPDIVYELLEKAGACFLIYEPSYSSLIQDRSCPVPTHPAEQVTEANTSSVVLPPLHHSHLTPEDIMMIFHTSGSTSGSPKLVPCSLGWLTSMISKAEAASCPYNSHRQDVSVWMGSMCHIAQSSMLLGALQHGACTIQPTKLPFPTSELVDMIHRCGLNRLTQFASFLGGYLRAARQDPKLLGMLSALDEVLFTGLALPREDEQWALEHGIKLRNLFGNTECAAMLRSVDGADGKARPDLLRPIEGVVCDFVPIESTAPSATSASASSPSEREYVATQHEDFSSVHINANNALLEFVIRSTSPDCPHPSLRASDGHFHTGDLFIATVAPDGAPAYIFRGRNDDWIKTANALRCDTKAVEDHVRFACGDIVNECVVVGTGRPSPTLFVEPKDDIEGEAGKEQLRRTIVRRTRAFNARRYLHERITDKKFVVVVPRGTLPRTATKGNVRRKLVEEKYMEVLDEIYGVTC